jgi:hypothetical protein
MLNPFWRLQKFWILGLKWWYFKRIFNIKINKQASEIQIFHKKKKIGSIGDSNSWPNDSNRNLLTIFIFHIPIKPSKTWGPKLILIKYKTNDTKNGRQAWILLHIWGTQRKILSWQLWLQLHSFDLIRDEQLHSHNLLYSLFKWSSGC